MQKNIRFILFILLITLVRNVISAQSKIDSIQLLSEVEIKAKIKQEAIHGQTLSGIELHRLGSFSVADAIRYFSGIQIKDYGGIGGLKTVNIRSMGTNHTGIFYDGIQLGNAQNGQIDLGKYSLDNIEDISLYNGQKSDMLQSAKDYSSANAIYIQSKTPHFKNKKTNIKASIKYGSFMLLSPSITFEHQINNNISLRVNSEFISSNGKYKFRYKRLLDNQNIAYDTTATRKNGDITAYRIEANVISNTPTKGNWNIHGYYYKSNRGLPGPIVKNVFSHGQRLNDEDFFIQGKFQKDLTPYYTFQFLTKFANDHTHYVDKEWTSPTFVNNRYEQCEFYTSLANRFIFNHFKFNVAADLLWNKMKANLVNFSYPTRYSFFSAVAAEYSNSYIILQASTLASFITEKVKYTTAAPSKKIITPTLLFSYTPFKNKSINISGFYKHIFRMPTFNDLYYTFIGNANLKPEYATQYNITLNYNKIFYHSLLKDLNFRIDAYINKINDKIIAVPAGNMFRWMMINLGKVDIKGIEISTTQDIQLFQQLHARTRLIYTFQKAIDITSASIQNYKHQIPYIPKHSGSFIASLDYGSWGVNYSFIYTGKRFNAKYNDLNSELQPWYTSDISIRKSILLNNMNLNILVDINNIFNQYYDVVLNYPMPGRNYRITLKFEF